MKEDDFLFDLKFFFKREGISQQQVADKLGVKQTFINAIFNGRKSIGRQTAQKLHDAYGLSVAWLLTGEGDMMAEPHITGGTHINITRGGNVSVKGGDNSFNSSASTTMESEVLQRMMEQNDNLTAQVARLTEQNAQLIEQNKKQTEIINTLISRQ